MSFKTYRSFSNDYNYMGNKYYSYTSKLKYKNPYEGKFGNYESQWKPIPREIDVDGERGNLDRVFDAISTPLYATAGIVRGFTSDEVNPLTGFLGGLWAGNPFGKGYEKGEHTYGKVLEDFGWKPETLGGKIAKGVVGFAGDVLLDPATYLSGGASAILRGTGKAGLEKGLLEGSAMTKEVAEELITEQAKKRGITLTAEELSKDADNLAKEYNRVTTGISNEATDLEFRLGNTLFGEKIYGKYADVGFKVASAKKLQEFGDKGIAPAYAKIRDSIYGSQLGKLFGSKTALYKMAKEDPTKLYDTLKVATITRGLNVDKLKANDEIFEKIRKIANLTPAEAKEVLEILQDKSMFQKVATKMNVLRTREAERMRKDLAKQKELKNKELDSLIDAKKAIDDLMKSKDEEIFQHTEVLEKTRDKYRETLAKMKTNKIKDTTQIEKAIKVLEEEITSLRQESGVVLADEDIVKVKEWLSKKDSGEILTGDDVVKQFDEYETIVKTPKQKEKIELSDDDKIKLEESRIKLDEEIKHYEEVKLNELKEAKMKADIKKDLIIDKYIKLETKVKKTFDALKKDPNNEELKNKATELYKKFQKAKKVRDKAVQTAGNSNQAYDDAVATYHTLKDRKATGKIAEMDISNEIKGIVKDADITDANKITVIKNLSKYLFGREDYISHTVFNHNLKKVVDMIREGQPTEEIKHFIEQNAQDFSGRASAIYTFVAEKMGYGIGTKYPGGWKEVYHDKMKELVERTDAGEITDAERRIVAELLQLKYQRQLLISKFNGADTVEDVMRIITDEKNKELDEIASGFKQSYNDKKKFDHAEARRTRMINEDVALEKRKTGEFDDKTKDLFLSFDEKESIKDDLFDMIFLRNGSVKNVNELTPRHGMWINKVFDEVQPLLDTFFKVPYSELSDKQKNLLYGLAQKNANARLDGKELVTKTNAELKKVADKLEERRQKAILLKHIDTVKNDVNQGAEIIAKHDNGRIKGIVEKIEIGDDNLPIYYVRSGDELIEVKPHQVEGRVPSNTITIRDLEKKSDIIRDFIAKKEDLEVKLSDAIKFLDETLEANKNFNRVSAGYKGYLTRLKKQAEDMKTNIEEAEKIKINLRQSLKQVDEKQLPELERALKEIDDALTNDDALHTLLKAKYGDDLERIVNADPDITAGEIVLDTARDIDDKVKEIALMIRRDFYKMGKDEVGIDKMAEGQFQANMLDYVFHALTPEGQAFFKSNDEVIKKIPGFGDDLGYGREFNPHAKTRTARNIPDIANGGWTYNAEKMRWIMTNETIARTIDKPTIGQLNELFEPMLKGKNAFSENIADIYMARALKHTELMYDNKYMENMMNVFGNDYTGVLEKGYNTVMNYGKLKQMTNEMTSLNISVDISDAVTNWVKGAEVLKEVETEVMAKLGSNYNPITYKIEFNEAMGRRIEEFMKTEYPDEVMKELYDERFTHFLQFSNLRGALDEVATPMVQFDEAQANQITKAYKNTLKRFTGNIKDKILSYEKNKYFELYGRGMDERTLANRTEELKYLDSKGLRQLVDDLIKQGDEGDIPRLTRFIQKLDKLDSIHAPQIKQVNEAIVQKANQSRKIQIAKDQNRFLQLYDKFTHLIKLNQTTVLPAFHVRNKMSNMFNNWLVIGKDAVNPTLQKHSALTVFHRGDMEKLKDLPKIQIANADGSVVEMDWAEIYRKAIEYDVLDEGFFAKDLGVGADTSGMIKKLSPKFDPTDSTNFILYKKGAEIGGQIENQDRLLSFASSLMNGKSFEEASELSTKALFDYSDLTHFEATVMKRIFPYYTWLRKNSALQLEMMIEQPKKYLYVNKVLDAVESMTNEEDRIDKDLVNDFAKDWIQLPFSVLNPQGRTEPVLWNPNLPFMDFGRMVNPADIGGSIAEAFTMGNPLFKVPLEQMANKNVFFDSPIVREDEENPLGARAEHVFNNFGLYGVGSGAVEKDGLDKALHLLNTVSGVKMLSYDYDAYKQMKLKELAEENKKEEGGSAYIDAIKRFLDRNDEPTEEEIEKLLERIKSKNN